MTTPNIYGSVYKNLEKEVLKLADLRHFSDDQTSDFCVFGNMCCQPAL